MDLIALRLVYTIVSSGSPYNGIPAEYYGIFRFSRNYVTDFREIPRSSVKYDIPKIIIPPELFSDGIMDTLIVSTHYTTVSSSLGATNREKSGTTGHMYNKYNIEWLLLTICLGRP